MGTSMMKLPSKVNHTQFMGKRCSFTAEYYRDYGKEKTDYMQEVGYTRKVPVKWKIQKHKTVKGWIVGFGFVFNGVIETEMDMGENYKCFIFNEYIDISHHYIC